MSDKIKRTVHTCIRRLLTSIIRTVVKSGVTYKEFCFLCKVAYIETVTKDFGIRGRPTNISRIALITGIDRKEIKRIKDLLEANALDRDTEKLENRLTLLLEAWFSEPGYLDHNNTPRALPLEGDTYSFLTLAKKLGGDIPINAIYKELLLSKSIHIDEEGKVRPLARRFLPTNTNTYDLIDIKEALDTLTLVNQIQKPQSKTRSHQAQKRPKIMLEEVY